jgi:hypothetical protein
MELARTSISQIDHYSTIRAYFRKSHKLNQTTIVGVLIYRNYV